MSFACSHTLISIYKTFHGHFKKLENCYISLIRQKLQNTNVRQNGFNLFRSLKYLIRNQLQTIKTILISKFYTQCHLRKKCIYISCRCSNTQCISIFYVQNELLLILTLLMQKLFSQWRAAR